MFGKLLLVLSVISVAPAKISLPPYIQKCSLSDPNFNQCYIDHANMAIPTISKGDKKYHFPILEPFKVDKIVIDTDSNLHVELNNIEMHGFSETKILTADNDIKNNKFTHTYFIPNVDMTADYELKGTIMVLSLEGKGTCAMTFKNVKSVYNVTYERVTKNDVEYMKRTTSSLDYDMEHATVQFDNLFNGNKQLGDEMNKVANENWKEIAGELKPAVSSTIRQIVDAVFDQFLEIVPIEEMFDP
ncbi:uncharacterized protein CBL_12141 [Carabus blaptoides fortunei]